MGALKLFLHVSLYCFERAFAENPSSICISNVKATDIQSGAETCSEGFVISFLKVPPACLGSMAAEVPGELSENMLQYLCNQTVEIRDSSATAAQSKEGTWSELTVGLQKTQN